MDICYCLHYPTAEYSPNSLPKYLPNSSIPKLPFLCMAIQLLAHVLADLCLGKPSLRSLSVSPTNADALAALQSSGDSSFISVWTCNHRPSKHCLCIGKVSVVDIVCYLYRDENLDSPAVALKAPVSALLPEAEGIVRHVDSSSRYFQFPP